MKKKTIGLLLALALSVCSTNLMAFEGGGISDISAAQSSVKISGTVVDAAGQPVIGATVQLKGSSTNATATNADGGFVLNVPEGSTLVVSSIGYTTQEVRAAQGVRIVLAEDAIAVEDVVVTALGIKKDKKTLVYAVQDIKAEELMKNKQTNVVNSMAGKIAGVNITQSSGAAGSGSNIVIRGGTSLERDNQPLFVVDGVIYDNSTSIGGNSGFDGMLATTTANANRVMDINPEDIESMSVLKGPVAAALYGSRAAAGAVVITTKRGQEGHVSVDFSTKYTTNWINRFPEQQSTYKQGEYTADGSINTANVYRSWGEAFGSGDTMYNNMEDFFQNGHSWDNTISVAGGSKNGSFYVSASRFDQTGLIPTTGYDKTTFRVNGEQKFGRLTVGANVAYSQANTDKALTAGLYDTGTGAMNSVYRWARNIDMSHYLNEDGSQYRQYAGSVELENDIDNPYWIINKDNLYDRTNRFTGSINAQFKVAEWFNISYRAGIDRYNKYDYTFIAPGSAVGRQYQNGRMSDSDREYEYLSSNLMLNFQKTVKDWDFSLMLGQTAEDTKTRTERRTGYDFVIDGLYSFSNIEQANKKFTSAHSRKRLVGVFGEARVGYKNIAYVTVTGRNDWSSTLPIDSRSYFYPSVGGAFIFSELLDDDSILSFGKLRGSWAKVGKDAPVYALTTQLWDVRTYINGISGYANSWTRGNPYLIPENTESWEVGADLRFFKGRLNVDFTYYDTKSYNNIITPRLSQASGYILLSVNCGTVRNKGIELQLSGTPVKTKDFTWESTLNLAHNEGTVGYLLQGTDILYVTDVQVGNAKAASFAGGQFMGISGSKWLRDDKGNVVLNEVADGVYLPVKDTNKGTTQYIGDREPDLTGGWNNNFTYKNWSLGFLFDFRLGGLIYNGTNYYMTAQGTSKFSEKRDSYTVTGVVQTGTTKVDGKDVPVYSDPETHTVTDRYYVQRYLTDEYLYESANFATKTNWLRLRSVTLSYSAPKEWLKKSGFIKGITVTASGNNLWLLTNYKGMDPEVSAAGSGVIGSSSVGIDYCGVPATAGFTFGVSLTF